MSLKQNKTACLNTFFVSKVITEWCIYCSFSRFLKLIELVTMHDLKSLKKSSFLSKSSKKHFISQTRVLETLLNRLTICGIVTQVVAVILASIHLSSVLLSLFLHLSQPPAPQSSVTFSMYCSRRDVLFSGLVS